MSKLLVAISTAIALGGGGALAADMPTKAPIMPPVVAYNWTGWYGGINAGYSWGHSNVDVTQSADPLASFGIVGCPLPAGCAYSQGISPKGFIGGAQAGYNYQSGRFVYGIEADLNWRHAQQSGAPVVFNVFGDNDVAKSQQNWVGTLRARLGFTPADRWLAFVSGGLAFGESQNTFTQQWCLLTGGPAAFCQPSRSVSGSVVKAGWAVGGGVQYAINNNWSVGAEYLYISLGSDTVTGATVGPFTPPFGTTYNYPAFTATFHDYSQVGRLRLDYKF